MKQEKIGVMNFHGSVDITDPCYNRDVWCRMNDVKIKEGDYDCLVWYHIEEREFAGKPYECRRVEKIGIFYNGIIPHWKSMEEIGDIGVDAGLAGFFHNKPDYSADEWSDFCDKISQGDAWLTKDGFFSSSGYGDGCYGVFAKKEDGEVVALEIRFV